MSDFVRVRKYKEHPGTLEIIPLQPGHTIYAAFAENMLDLGADVLQDRFGSDNVHMIHVKISVELQGYVSTGVIDAMGDVPDEKGMA